MCSETRPPEIPAVLVVRETLTRATHSLTHAFCGPRLPRIANYRVGSAFVIHLATHALMYLGMIRVSYFCTRGMGLGILWNCSFVVVVALRHLTIHVSV